MSCRLADVPRLAVAEWGLLWVRGLLRVRYRRSGRGKSGGTRLPWAMCCGATTTQSTSNSPASAKPSPLTEWLASLKTRKSMTKAPWLPDERRPSGPRRGSGTNAMHISSTDVWPGPRTLHQDTCQGL